MAYWWNSIPILWLYAIYKTKLTRWKWREFLLLNRFALIRYSTVTKATKFLNTISVGILSDCVIVCCFVSTVNAKFTTAISLPNTIEIHLFIHLNANDTSFFWLINYQTNLILVFKLKFLRKKHFTGIDWFDRKKNYFAFLQKTNWLIQTTSAYWFEICCDNTHWPLIWIEMDFCFHLEMLHAVQCRLHAYTADVFVFVCLVALRLFSLCQRRLSAFHWVPLIIVNTLIGLSWAFVSLCFVYESKLETEQQKQKITETVVNEILLYQHLWPSEVSFSLYWINIYTHF